MRVSMHTETHNTGTQPEGIAAWVLNKLLTFRGRSATEKRELSLLETLSLGGKRQLILVACGGQRYLVGVGPESVQTIVLVLRETKAGSNNFSGETP
jgi:flagellar biogenesis protein FliO